MIREIWHTLRSQGCALRKIEGCPVLWTCKIYGAQHMICMKRLRFSSRPGAKVGRQRTTGFARAQPRKYFAILLRTAWKFGGGSGIICPSLFMIPAFFTQWFMIHWHFFRDSWFIVLRLRFHPRMEVSWPRLHYSTGIITGYRPHITLWSPKFECGHIPEHFISQVKLLFAESPNHRKFFQLQYTCVA